MTWPDISSAGLCRTTRRCGHGAGPLPRTDETGANGPAEAHVGRAGAALATGARTDSVAVARPDPADVVAEHPVQTSASNATATACACFTGSLHDT